MPYSRPRVFIQKEPQHFGIFFHFSLHYFLGCLDHCSQQLGLDDSVFVFTAFRDHNHLQTHHAITGLFENLFNPLLVMCYLGFLNFASQIAPLTHSDYETVTLIFPSCLSQSPYFCFNVQVVVFVDVQPKLHFHSVCKNVGLKLDHASFSSNLGLVVFCPIRISYVISKTNTAGIQQLQMYSASLIKLRFMCITVSVRLSRGSLILYAVFLDLFSPLIKFLISLLISPYH